MVLSNETFNQSVRTEYSEAVNARYTFQPLWVSDCILLYCTVLYCTVLYCTVLYCTVLYCTVLYCTVLYCTVLYCTVLYCIVLYCIVIMALIPGGQAHCFVYDFIQFFCLNYTKRQRKTRQRLPIYTVTTLGG